MGEWIVRFNGMDVDVCDDRETAERVAKALAEADETADVFVWREKGDE